MKHPTFVRINQSFTKQSPFEFCQERKGELDFYEGVPFCVYCDDFGWNNYIFWDQSNQSGILKLASRLECLMCGQKMIDDYFDSVSCAFCIKTSLEQMKESGRYHCVECDRISAIYLWQHESDDPDVEKFDLCFNYPKR